MSDAARQQRRRERQRQGRRLVHLEIDEVRVEHMLRAGKLLGPCEDGPEALTEALGEQIDIWCELAERHA